MDAALLQPASPSAAPIRLELAVGTWRCGNIRVVAGARARPVEAVTRTHRPQRATHCLNAWEHRNRGMVARAAETETRVVEGAQNTNSETPG